MILSPNQSASLRGRPTRSHSGSAIMFAMPDDERQQRDLEAFEKHIREAVLERERQRRQQREREPEPERPRQQNRDNPLELPERHRTENAGPQEQRLRT